MPFFLDFVHVSSLDKNSSRGEGDSLFPFFYQVNGLHA